MILEEGRKRRGQTWTHHIKRDRVYSQGDSQIIKIINRQVGSQLVGNSYYTSHATFDRKSVQLQINQQFKNCT